MSLPKGYIASDYEKDIYDLWEQSGAFQPRKAHGEPFVISMPPPNATGHLHVGHASRVATEDLMIRYHRMKGDETLWLPGTDHAAIATESVVIRKIQEEQGIADPRAQLGREKVLEHIAEFVENSRGVIRNQLRSVGASCDWSRERYTMDPALNRMVNEVFKKMYLDELIYRGHRIVNWDPKLQTNVSDDEVERVEEKTTFYTFKYGPFEIGTARPETKFGDKYVVMHPDDKRYANYKHGQTFEAEWINGPVTATVIKDEAVDPSFGTGVMTITPWHDVADFEIAERHNLDKQQIIDFEGNLLDVAEEFAGMSIEEARPQIAAKLDAKGLLAKTDDEYVHSIAVNSRGKGVIEPQIRLQWFIDVNKEVIKWKGKKSSLKQVMRAVVEDGDIRIIPKRFEKTYFHWIDNLHDWCISRQIWWGHRIPVWYRGDEMYIDAQSPAEALDPKDKGAGKWEQDPDTLDTWFSSGLWTWSTLVDPDLTDDFDLTLEDILKKSPDYQRFHPTTVLETAYDILFFWVARMILMTTYATGEVPFKNVYLGGLIRTKDGAKMSKSHPETIIDPLEIIPEYGADALRLSLVIGNTPGNDARIFKEKIAGYRNFCNKLWNVARYVLAQLPEDYKQAKPKFETGAEQWIHHRINQTIKSVTSSLERYRFSDGGDQIYHLLWDDFADWYIEVSKTENNPDVLIYGLETILKLAHPFAPFVTETIWQNLPYRDDLLITQEWPELDKDKYQPGEFETVKQLVSEIRSYWADMQLRDSTLYYSDSKLLSDNAELIKRLANIAGVEQVSDGRGMFLTSTDIRCWMGVSPSLIKNYLSTLIENRKQKQNQIKSLQAKLENKNYVSRAPKDIVTETRDMLAETEAEVDRLSNQIGNLEKSL